MQSVSVELAQCCRAVDGGVAGLHPWRNQRTAGSVRHRVALAIALAIRSEPPNARVSSPRNPRFHSWRICRTRSRACPEQGTGPDRRERSADRAICAVRRAMEERLRPRARRDQRGRRDQGRPLAYVFEDSQSDPRQSVTIARKYVADERIVVELGDFSSAASMAASPIYQAAGLVQFGFTNSHPDFTKGGDFIWSNAVSQADEMPLLADFVRDLGLKRVAVLHLNTDWGRTAKDLFVAAIKEHGGEVVGSEAYLAGREGLPLGDRACALVEPGLARADLLLSGRRANRAADAPGRHDAADRRRRLGLFAEIPGARRRRGERRAHHGAVLPRRSAPGGADIREGFEAKFKARAGRLQRPRLRHVDPAGAP